MEECTTEVTKYDHNSLVQFGDLNVMYKTLVCEGGLVLPSF